MLNNYLQCFDIHVLCFLLKKNSECEMFLMKPRKFEVIECPRCGRQYLPAEIFIPKVFFGKPRDIVRDVYGKILEYEDTSLDSTESYTCDKCNTTFEVKAKISFFTDTNKSSNMDDDYISSVKVSSLFLND